MSWGSLINVVAVSSSSTRVGLLSGFTWEGLPAACGGRGFPPGTDRFPTATMLAAVVQVNNKQLNK